MGNSPKHKVGGKSADPLGELYGNSVLQPDTLSPGPHALAHAHTHSPLHRLRFTHGSRSPRHLRALWPVLRGWLSKIKTNRVDREGEHNVEKIRVHKHHASASLSLNEISLPRFGCVYVRHTIQTIQQVVNKNQNNYLALFRSRSRVKAGYNGKISQNLHKF